MTGTNAPNLPDSGCSSFKSRLPLLSAITITVLFAVSLTVGLSYVGYYFLLRPSTRLDGISYQDLVEIMKIALAVVAGIGGTVALTVAVRKQKVVERQHRLSEADANRQDRRILHERFQNAVELLGKKESAAVRIGGAYSLEKLADDWPEERQTCINVLCGYLRFPYDLPSGADGEREVRRTIIDIVRKHLLQGADVPWDGNLFDLSGATLDHLDLSDIYLKESTLRLRGCLVQVATFKMKGLLVVGGEVDAREIRIMDGATLVYISMYTSRDMNRKNRPYGVVMLCDAELGSGHISFDGAIARGALLQFSGIRASGGKIALTGIQFEALAISFWNADLSGECEIEIRSLYHPPFPDVTVLYSQAYGGLNSRVVLGERIELLEVSAAD